MGEYYKYLLNFIKKRNDVPIIGITRIFKGFSLIYTIVYKQQHHNYFGRLNGKKNFGNERRI
jgi:hypothetical protein